MNDCTCSFCYLLPIYIYSVLCCLEISWIWLDLISVRSVVRSDGQGEGWPPTCTRWGMWYRNSWMRRLRERNGIQHRLSRDITFYFLDFSFLIIDSSTSKPLAADSAYTKHLKNAPYYRWSWAGSTRSEQESLKVASI